MGKKLLEYVIKNHNINELDVNEQNQNAVNFYKYMGFEVINRSEKEVLENLFLFYI
ncbi:GNAT family N-acetyltransferase [Arcobacter cryaerophilus gv. pseudocryaerophilus]